MIYAPGVTSQSIDVQIVDDTGLPVTGLVAATFPATSWSRGGNTAATSISLSDLSLITSAYSSGGVKERSGGYYRLDLPDAVLASAGKITLIGEATDKRLLAPRLDVEYVQVDVEQWKGSTAPAMTGDAYARLGAPSGASTSADIAAVKTDTGSIKAKTDNLPADPAGLSNLASTHGAGSWATATGFSTFDPTATGVFLSTTYGNALLAAISSQITSDHGSGSYIRNTEPPTAATVASTVLTTQMTEAYASNGTAPTLAQISFMIYSAVQNFSIAGTTLSEQKLDGVTVWATVTLDDATNPTSRTRAT